MFKWLLRAIKKQKVENVQEHKTVANEYLVYFCPTIKGESQFFARIQWQIVIQKGDILNFSPGIFQGSTIGSKNLIWKVDNVVHHVDLGFRCSGIILVVSPTHDPMKLSPSFNGQIDI